MSIDSIVVAGGGALRLGGIDKMRLPLGGDGKTLLAQVVSNCPGKVIVVGSKRNVAGVAAWLNDEAPDSGPAAAIWTGLSVVETEYVFISAGDQVLQGGTVSKLVAAAQGQDGAWAIREDGTGQPLCAVVKTELIRELLAPTKGVNQSPLKLMSTLNMQPVKVASGAITDIDTWEDVRRLAKDMGVDMSKAWLDVVGATLGVDPAEVPAESLLDLTRDVADSVERKYAPLTTYMLGLAAGKTGRPVAELIAAVETALNESGASE